MTTRVTRRTKTKAPRRAKEFEGLPYNDYTVAISDAAQTAIATEIATMNAESDPEDKMTITVGIFVIGMATIMYKRNGLPTEIYSSFICKRHDRDESMTVTCNHQDKFLVCWLTSEQEGDKMPKLHLIEGHIAQSFLTKYMPDKRILH
jgi:hypothetical protein